MKPIIHQKLLLSLQIIANNSKTFYFLNDCGLSLESLDYLRVVTSERVQPLDVS